jgi:hypothetical protein
MMWTVDGAVAPKCYLSLGVPIDITGLRLALNWYAGLWLVLLAMRSCSQVVLPLLAPCRCNGQSDQRESRPLAVEAAADPRVHMCVMNSVTSASAYSSPNHVPRPWLILLSCHPQPRQYPVGTSHDFPTPNLQKQT